MRNTRLYIIISVVVLIIVGIIASILTNQLKKGGQLNNTDQNAEKVETTGTKSLSRTEKYREAARITKQSNTSLLSDNQVKRLNTLSKEVSSGQGGVITGENFDIGYSNITNLFCVQKKTSAGDAEFKNYLTEKQALDIYEKDPSLFVTSSENCATYLKKQEEYIVQDLELDGEDFPAEEKKTYDEVRKENREKNLEVLKKLASTLFSPSTAGVDSLESYLFNIEEDAEGNQTEGNQIATQSAATGSNSLVISYPSSLGTVNSKGYFKMPPALNGEYVFGGWNRCDSHKYGSKTLIGAIYTAALKWKAKYPQYTFRIGDLNAGPPHSSHKNGVDVDIVTYGNWSIQIAAPTEVNVDLGKAFIDTGIIKLIILGVSPTNPKPLAVRNAWKEYANSKGLPFQTYATKSHDNHFHVRINDEFRGPVDSPGPCR